ncbi:MAG: cysteine desulfurase, partial [Candidatus Porifericomitaceae bacterium WSBS_2022_MAG_OTU9]
DRYEQVRDDVCSWINASRREEIIFVRGTTEAINLVAHSYGGKLGPGDEVLITGMEHHSNIVPWQLLCERSGASLKYIPLTDQGELDTGNIANVLGKNTRVLAITHVANSIGTINDISDLSARAHRCGAVVLVDGAQAVPHMAIDVRQLGCDFYAFSGHKLFAPTGIGVLYGRYDLLTEMPPWQGGGDMIAEVTMERSSYSHPPAKFEAGTPNIAGVIGLGAAINYMQGQDADALHHHENELLENATQQLLEVPGLRLIGTAANKCAIVSFVVDGVHAHDVGTVLDRQGVAVRAGHHCSMPVMQRYKVAATVRASFAFYNTHDEVDRLAVGVRKTMEIFK